MAKIIRVGIYDTLGIQELEFEAGQWNEITGGNGQGKTSVLEAIKANLSGGNDATLIRKGSDQSETVIVFDDGHTVRKKIGKGAGVVVEKDGKRMEKPQVYLNGLRDMLSVNPVDFLRAKPSARRDVLLQSMPLKVDPERISKILGDPDFQADTESHALEVIAAVRKTVFDERTGTNRAVREKESTINQLDATLPKEGEVDGVHPDDNEETLTARLTALDEAWQAEQLRIDTKLGDLRTEKDTAVAALREQIAALQAQITEAVEAFSGIESRAGQQRALQEQRWRDSRAGPQRALDLVRANRDAVARAAQTRDTIKMLRAEANELDRDADKQTRMLEALDAYKTELLATLPVPGLEVTADGDLMRDGVPFDRLNKAQQAGIAIEIAKLRAGALRVVCVDELEMLDAEHREALIQQAAEADLQFFVTRVADDGGPLTITAQ